MVKFVTEIDLDDVHTETLIEEVQERGYKVIEDTLEDPETTTDKIHDFYHDYLLWKEFGMKNETFQDIANKFFEEQLGTLVN
jgi:hypothetical protein